MRTNNQTYKNFTMQYPLEQIAPPKQVLFVDIETTGFTAKISDSFHSFLLPLSF